MVTQQQQRNRSTRAAQNFALRKLHDDQPTRCECRACEENAALEATWEQPIDKVFGREIDKPVITHHSTKVCEYHGLRFARRHRLPAPPVHITRH